MIQNVHNNGHKSLLMDSIISQQNLYKCTLLNYFFMTNSGIFTPFIAIPSKHFVYISYLSNTFDTQIFSSTLFLHTVNLFSTERFEDQVSEPYNMGK
jgi:hypothetical protein